MATTRRILVGLKTADQADQLMELACALGAPDTAILIVHVIELPDVTPLDAEVPDLVSAAEAILGRAERFAREHGMRAKTEILRAHGAASALVDEMREHRIDLAVLGYHHERKLSELVLGTTARHVAKQAPCRIVLDIPPREGR